MTPGEVIRLSKSASLIAGQNKGRFPHCNSMIIQGNGVTAIIDPCCGPEVIKPWVDKVDIVLNTHTHSDHAGGNWHFADKRIMVPEYSFATAGSMDKLSRRYVKTDSQVKGWLRSARESAGMRDTQPSGFFQPDEELDIGGVRVIALDTPGHTYDHTSFYLPDEGVVYSGDIDLTTFGPWYANPESDIGLFRRSVRRIGEFKPKVMAPAHRPPVVEDIDQALVDYLAIFQRREAGLLTLLKKPHTWPEIIEAGIIYTPDRVKRFRLIHYFERQMMGKHLDELLADKRVKFQAGKFRIA